MSYSKTVLIGRLGQDPELRYTNNQTAVCNFSIATSERVKRGSEWTDDVTWHRITAWGKTAENCNQFLHKGSQVCVEGKIRYEKWKADDGSEKQRTVINANLVHFLGGKSAQGSTSREERIGEGAVSFDDDNIPF